MMTNDFANTTQTPGVWAHGYFDHTDGYFIVLYAWLWLASNGGQGMAADKAWKAAKKVADESQTPVTTPGGGATYHVDISNYT